MLLNLAAAAVAVLFLNAPAHGQNINVLPAGDLRVALGTARVDQTALPTVIASGSCEVRTGDAGVVRWRALSLFDEDHSLNTVQVLAVEFSGGCWLFFARAFDRKKSEPPAASLVGSFQVNGSGRLSMEYARFGSTPVEQAESLARRLSGQFADVLPPVPSLPVSLMKIP